MSDELSDDPGGKRGDAIEKIEASYEFMLAYAAQGREREGPVGGEGLSIRKFLNDLENGLETLAIDLVEDMSALKPEPATHRAFEHFRDMLAQDAEAALAAVRLVQRVPSISSQLIDNLNASVHLRCLLTDIFVVDEALNIIRREAKSSAPTGS